MRFIIGIIIFLVGIGWLIWASVRNKNKREPLQTIIDFFTGSPIESILIVSSILFGIILILAHFLA